MSKAFGIGIDGYNLAMPEGTGVATYGRTLAHAVKARGYATCGLYGLHIPTETEPGLRETLFFGALGDTQPAKRTLRRLLLQVAVPPGAREPQPIPRTGEVITAGFEHRVPPFDRLFNSRNLFAVGARYFRYYGRFLPLRLPDPPAIMHWTYPVPIRVLGAQNLYTMHDIVPLRLPYTSTEDKRYYRRLLQQCIQTGPIVTVSENSRADILRQFPGTDPARITNTYQAVLPETSVQELTPEELAHRLETLFGLRAGGYFLFFGAAEPKKNIGRILEAYISAGIATPLVMVSGGGWRGENEWRLLDGMDGRGPAGAQQVRRMSYLPRSLLMLLVRGARAVLMPSLYEGFGLPVLEAMTLGVPVLTANGHAQAEVSAGAALQVDPYSVRDIRQGLIQLDSDDGLRQRLAAAGPQRADFFSMARYETRVDTLYQSLLDAGQSHGIKRAP